MERNKLISLRIDTEVWSKIDKLAGASEYLTRSRIINACMNAMVHCVVGDGLWKVLNSFDPYADGIEVHIVERKKQTN
jgi:hypothetical protein